MKKLSDRQWHIPIFLYGCNKVRLASSLLQSNEQQAKNLATDVYIDCTKGDNESTNGTLMMPVTTAPTILKPRKRGTVRKKYT